MKGKVSVICSTIFVGATIPPPPFPPQRITHGFTPRHRGVDNYNSTKTTFVSLPSYLLYPVYTPCHYLPTRPGLICGVSRTERIVTSRTLPCKRSHKCILLNWSNLLEGSSLMTRRARSGVVITDAGVC